MKDILITGAYGGMGRATAELLCKQGFRVFALDRRIGKASDGIIPIEADLTSEAAVRAAVEQISAYTDSLCAMCEGPEAVSYLRSAARCM